jgi:hypothetical protein
MRHLITRSIVLVAATWLAQPAAAQIRVNPTGVNVSSQTATTVFLTFGPLNGYAPAESLWCGDVRSAAPAFGVECEPATIYGSLPTRYDRSSLQSDSFTDIMSLPASVARRAYQAAAAGRSAEFFYVRHFVKAGAPDQFVAVTCRLTGGGARVPLSLVDVQLAFSVETPVLQVAAGDTVPSFSAEIVYTGTGRLQGRWEVVLPGQELPTAEDLLPEASLPVEQRGTQHRYLEIDRFNVFLEPTGRYTLAGPDRNKLPTGIDGQYLILLRIETSDDKEADSDLSAVGAGPGVIHAGGVSGVPMPTLRYVVGGGGSEMSPVRGASMTNLQPADEATLHATDPVDLVWAPVPLTSYYRVEIESGGKVIHEAFVTPGAPTYRLPPFVFDRVVNNELRWRIVAVDARGHDGVKSEWRRIKVASQDEHALLEERR